MLSFREETLIHLLTEYAWAGAMLCLFRVYYEAAKELGTPPETATFSAGWLKMLLARNIEPMLLEGISK
ncbi:MAG: hypothetical protein JRN10_05060 [Nitrososphaerota archaeon]|nr:hypothetical protein [Nitrososphaerota archaeon]MDG6930590.1 hypothetical protein [Nitrososphaerota archaeon]